MKPWTVLASFCLAATSLAVLAEPGRFALEPAAFRHYVERFNQQDNELYRQAVPNTESWDWMQRNVPLFECPDAEL